MVHAIGTGRLPLIVAGFVLLSVTHLNAQGPGQCEMALKNAGDFAAIDPEPGTDAAVEPQGSLRFEPITMLGDLYRKDIVFLMRHGPTDWSQIDARGVDRRTASASA